jgi:hypothetical protein
MRRLVIPVVFGCALANGPAFASPKAERFDLGRWLALTAPTVSTPAELVRAYARDPAKVDGARGTPAYARFVEQAAELREAQRALAGSSNQAGLVFLAKTAELRARQALDKTEAEILFRCRRPDAPTVLPSRNAFGRGRPAFLRRASPPTRSW